MQRAGEDDPNEIGGEQGQGHITGGETLAFGVGVVCLGGYQPLGEERVEPMDEGVGACACWACVVGLDGRGF